MKMNAEKDYVPPETEVLEVSTEGLVCASPSKYQYNNPFPSGEDW